MYKRQRRQEEFEWPSRQLQQSAASAGADAAKKTDATSEIRLNLGIKLEVLKGFITCILPNRASKKNQGLYKALADQILSKA